MLYKQKSIIFSILLIVILFTVTPLFFKNNKSNADSDCGACVSVDYYKTIGDITLKIISAYKPPSESDWMALLNHANKSGLDSQPTTEGAWWDTGWSTRQPIEKGVSGSYVTISADPNIIYLSGVSNQTIETTLRYQLYSSTPSNYTCTISSDSPALGISGLRATQGSEKVSLPEAVKNYKFTYTCTNTKIAEVLSSSTIVQVVNGICDNRYHYGCKKIGNKYSSDAESFCTRLDGAGVNDCTKCADWDLITVSLLSQSCSNSKLNAFSLVFGGFKPYTKYTWYYRAVSNTITNPNPWVIAEDIPCISPNDCGSYEYDFSKLTQTGNGSYQYYLRVEDCLGESGASDIFTTTCTNSSRCGIDEYGKFFCSSSGTGGSCNSVSDCGTCKKR